jgi:hypothetical protein
MQHVRAVLRVDGLILWVLLSACADRSAPDRAHLFSPTARWCPTYRLSRWQSIGRDRIAWEEDGPRIEATAVQATADAFRLRLRLVSEVKASVSSVK